MGMSGVGVVRMIVTVLVEGNEINLCVGLSGIQLMCGECGNSYRPELNQVKRCF